MSVFSLMYTTCDGITCVWSVVCGRWSGVCPRHQGLSYWRAAIWKYQDYNIWLQFLCLVHTHFDHSSNSPNHTYFHISNSLKHAYVHCLDPLKHAYVHCLELLKHAYVHRLDPLKHAYVHCLELLKHAHYYDPLNNVFTLLIIHEMTMVNSFQIKNSQKHHEIQTDVK